MATVGAPAAYRLRPITPADGPGLTRFYSGLSADSRFARFHGVVPTITDATATIFCGPDHEHREGIVAEYVDAAGDRSIIGHVCIEPTTEDVAEMAIAVADSWQGHGVGRAMLASAIIWARRRGILRLVASLQCGNTALLGLVRSAGCPVTYGPAIAGTIDACLDLRNSRSVAA
jgi:acetyltransferase